MYPLAVATLYNLIQQQPLLLSLALLSTYASYLGSRHYKGCRNLYETLLWGIVDLHDNNQSIKIYNATARIVYIIEKTLLIYSAVALLIIVISTALQNHTLSNLLMLKILFYLNLLISLIYISGSVIGHLARANLYIKFYHIR